MQAVNYAFSLFPCVISLTKKHSNRITWSPITFVISWSPYEWSLISRLMVSGSYWQVDEHTGWTAGRYGVGGPRAKRTKRLWRAGNMEHKMYSEILNSLMHRLVTYHCGWTNDLSVLWWRTRVWVGQRWWPKMDGRCVCPTGVELGKTRECRAHCTDNGAPRGGDRAEHLLGTATASSWKSHDSP